MNVLVHFIIPGLMFCTCSSQRSQWIRNIHSPHMLKILYFGFELYIPLIQTVHKHHAHAVWEVLQAAAADHDELLTRC